MSYLTSLAEESDTDIANELIELQQRLATAPDDSAAIPFSFNDLPGKTFLKHITTMKIRRHTLF